MFAEVEKVTEEEEEDDPEAEPEDDFNAAWEVLDLARAIFEKQKDESDEAKLKLADAYMSLGDVSLETGSFIFHPCTYNVALIPSRKVRSSSQRLHGWAKYQTRAPTTFLSSYCRGPLPPLPRFGHDTRTIICSNFPRRESFAECRSTHPGAPCWTAAAKHFTILGL